MTINSSANTATYRESHRQPGTGASYDRTMNDGYLSALWRSVERPLIEATLRRHRAAGARTVVDFACGTGRITQVNEGVFPRSIGIDISAEMVTRARVRCPRSEFRVLDPTRPSIALLPEADVVTTFRFLLNAEDDLRAEALAAIRKLLRPHGVLIAGFQWNEHSPAGLFYRARNVVRRTNNPRTITTAGARRLLEEHGFAPMSVAPYGVWPRTGRHLSHLHARMIEPTERLAFRCPVLMRAAQHFLVTARRLAGPDD